MEKRHYALIAALYDTEGAGLYQDIYFPIVKYALAILHTQQIDTNEYYTLPKLQDLILSKFGIKIPLIVLKQCVYILGNKVNPDVVITTFKNGEQFLIKKIWDTSMEKVIETKFSAVESNFEELEIEFRKFLDLEMIESETSFLNFINDNAIDFYDYIENEANDIKVNEKYYHVARFLKLIQHSKTSLYNTANNIFWGSIISAFLQREVDLSLKPKENIRYYLDTSLIMSLLDLASEENVQYAMELLTIIKAAGGIPCVHGLTIREVDSILYSVEKSQYPYPGSSIESAYYRRELSSSKIKLIRSNLNKTIENPDNLGLIIEPVISDQGNDDIIARYKKNLNVIALQKDRGKKEFNDRKENLGEIHDIFLIDYINAKRGKVSSLEKIPISFISLNTELISFASENYSTKLPLIIHPSKVVLDLWIHNSKHSSIKGISLNETMSRCIALNDTDVRRKIRTVAKNNKSENITKEDYVILETALINRDKEVIMEIDHLKSNSNDIEKSQQNIFNAISIAKNKEQERNDLFALRTKEAENLSIKLEEVTNEKIDTLRKEKEAAEKRANELEELIRQEKLTEENKKRSKKRKEFIENELKKWRWSSWKLLIGCLIFAVIATVFLLWMSEWNFSKAIEYIENLNKNIVLTTIVAVLSYIINICVIGVLVNKYSNHSNINAYISKIQVPKEYEELKENSLVV